MHTTRLLKIAAVSSAAALMLAACGGSLTTASPAPPQRARPLPSEAAAAPPVARPSPVPWATARVQVNILAWPGYVEDGSTDPAVDWVTPFEEETGCEVERQDVRHLRRGRAS